MVYHGSPVAMLHSTGGLNIVSLTAISIAILVLVRGYVLCCRVSVALRGFSPYLSTSLPGAGAPDRKEIDTDSGAEQKMQGSHLGNVPLLFRIVERDWCNENPAGGTCSSTAGEEKSNSYAYAPSSSVLLFFTPDTVAIRETTAIVSNSGPRVGARVRSTLYGISGRNAGMIDIKSVWPAIGCRSRKSPVRGIRICTLQAYTSYTLVLNTPQTISPNQSGHGGLSVPKFPCPCCRLNNTVARSLTSTGKSRMDVNSYTLGSGE